MFFSLFFFFLVFHINYSLIIKSMALKNLFFGIANWIWQKTEPIMGCSNTHLIQWHGARKAYQNPFMGYWNHGILKSINSIYMLFCSTYIISVEVKKYSPAKKEFPRFCRIMPEFARFSRKIPDFAAGMAKSRKCRHFPNPEWN